MLLFVVRSQFDLASELPASDQLKQLLDPFVHVASIAKHLVQSGRENEERSRFSGNSAKLR